MALFSRLRRTLGRAGEGARERIEPILKYDIKGAPGAAWRGARRGVRGGIERYKNLSPEARKALTVGTGGTGAALGTYHFAGKPLAEKYQNLAWPEQVEDPDTPGELIPGRQPGELGATDMKVPLSQRMAAGTRETIPGRTGELLGGAIDFAGRHPFITAGAVGVPALALYYLLSKDDDERR